MASRFPPSGNDNRYPRGRSPPRFPDRRTSVPHGGFQGRNSDSSYRPGEEGPREPPRGPKGHYNEPPRGGPYTPRGRGFPRGGRAGYDSFSRRDSERSWSERREDYDRRPSPVGRGRSRSPHGFRDARDTRDPPDSARNFDSPTDHRNRGGFTGRGRGFERGGRGRPYGSQDRDRFRARSRSRDRFLEDSRDERFDRDAARREDDRWDRGREGSRRDGPPLRPESRVFDDHTRTTSPSNASSASGPYGRPSAVDNNSHPRALSDSARRSSFPASAQPDSRAKEEMRQPQSAGHPPSSPPQAPSVPAYGLDPASLAESSRRSSTLASNAKAAAENAKAAATSPGSGLPNAPIGPRSEGPRADVRSETSDPLKDAPKGPKADMAKATIPMQQPIRRSMSNTMPAGRPFENQDSRASGSTTLPQIPSGPRALTERRPPTLDTNFSNQSASTAFAPAPRAIPTGPKNMVMPNAPSSNVWVRPAARQPPSGPASANSAKRESFGEERSRRPSTGEPKPVDTSSAHTNAMVKDENGSEEEEEVYTPPEQLPEHIMDVDEQPKEETNPVSEQIPDSDFALPQSDDDDAVSDDGMSEEDLRAQEAKYARDKDQLELKRPPPDSEDNELLVMLDELDALAVALDDLKEGRWPPPKKESEETEPVPQLRDIPLMPSPQSTPTPPSGQMRDHLEGEASEEDEDLDGLPYKRTSPPTPVSQISVFKTDFSAFASQRQKMLQNLALRNKAEHSDAELLRDEFTKHFFTWRANVDEWDQNREAKEEANAAAESTSDMPETPGLATLALETTRGRRGFTTQLELDQALALSKQTHAEEQARAKETERDMLTVPDMTKESIIPDMLNHRMREQSQYKDSNNTVDVENALEVFKFVPPEDDFTEEEQELFKKAYERNARKQWGHIAKEIPGRTYKDCIMHYYLTKRVDKYKKLLQKKSTKRGRQGKGKTNALLSNLAARPDDDGSGKVEVTDTGRPKRAAAPTNFDRRQAQEIETTPQRGKGRGKAQAKVAEGPENASDKPTRGKASGKERGGRRGRGAGAAGSGVGRGRMPATDGTSEALAEEPIQPTTTMMEDARLLTEFQSSTNAPIMVPSGHTENWLNPPSVGYPQQLAQAQIQPPLAREAMEKPPQISVQEQPIFSDRNERLTQPTVQPRPEPEPSRLLEPEPVLAPTPAAPAAPTPNPSKRGGSTATGRSNQSSSYWSVLEQNQVLSWAPLLGSSWDDYASRMKAKSAVMVRNHVNRLTQDNKNPDLQTALRDADEENKKDPDRIEKLTLEGRIDAPLGNETPATLQRPLAPSRKTSTEVKQEREEKPSRARADSHIAVAPKPPQTASLEASPANRPRVKSNASTKSAIVPQKQPMQQTQPSQQMQGPPKGYFDPPPSQAKEQQHHPLRASDPRQDHRQEQRHEQRIEQRNDVRPVPVATNTVPPMQQQQQPPVESRPSTSERGSKWTISSAFTPRENTISNSYSTVTGTHHRSGIQDEVPHEPRHVGAQQPLRQSIQQQPPQQQQQQQQQQHPQAPFGVHGSPYTRNEERPPLDRPGVNNVPLRHEQEQSRTPQVLPLSHPAAEERPSSRMPLHVEQQNVYQSRPIEAPMAPQQQQSPAYNYPREPSRQPVPPQPSLGSLLSRDEQSSRPNPSALGIGHASPAGLSMHHHQSHGPGVVAVPTPKPASTPAPPALAAPKRSNIMSLLNNDEEPAPKRITTETRAPAPVPTPPPAQQAPIPAPPYPTLGQSSYSRQPYPSSFAESPYPPRDTPPERPALQQHPLQHPGVQYEQRQSNPPPSSLGPQHHYAHAQPPPPSHLPHDHGRTWQTSSVQPQHNFPHPDQPRYSAYSHSSTPPPRPSFVPPPPSHAHAHAPYPSSTPAPPAYGGPPAVQHHSRQPPSLSTPGRAQEHAGLPSSIYSRGGPPPPMQHQHQAIGAPGPPTSLLSRPPSAFGGSSLAQEQMRLQDGQREHEDRERARREEERQRQQQQGQPPSMYPPRDYASTPHGGAYRGPPPPHYPPQGR